MASDWFSELAAMVFNAFRLVTPSWVISCWVRIDVPAWDSVFAALMVAFGWAHPADRSP